jgi:hypothetical protein
MASRKYVSSKENCERLPKHQKPSGISGGGIQKQRKFSQLVRGAKLRAPDSGPPAPPGPPRQLRFAFPIMVGH